MTIESKIYRWYYSDKPVTGVSSSGRPQVDEGPHIISSSLLTQDDSTQKVSGKIDSITLGLVLRRPGTSTVSVDTTFTLSNETNSYSSNTVTCSGITDTSSTRHIITMPAENCPSANFFNNSFTLTVSYSNISRTKIYCPQNDYFILTVNYTKGCQIYVKVNGIWKEATPYININGVWEEANSSIKENGTWKQ